MEPLHCGTHTLTFDRTLVMGILNVTPDSFSDGEKFFDTGRAVAHAEAMVENGADIIDVGGESSRPGAASVSEKEELRRIIPVITRLAALDTPISVDTYKPGVAAAALKAGATIINDITGLQNAAMRDLAAQQNVPVIIMHMQGTPQSMQQDPQYGDVVEDIKMFFKERIALAKTAGVKQIVLDPGIGFGKKLKHNIQLLKRLYEFNELGYPLLIGTSRKSFLGTLGLPAEERLEGTIASNTIGIMNGAHIIRVHDVEECKRAAMIVDAVKHG